MYSVLKCFDYSLQDEKLKRLVEHHGSEDWKVIASFLPVSVCLWMIVSMIVLICVRLCMRLVYLSFRGLGYVRCGGLDTSICMWIAKGSGSVEVGARFGEFCIIGYSSLAGLVWNRVKGGGYGKVSESTVHLHSHTDVHRHTHTHTYTNAHSGRSIC